MTRQQIFSDIIRESPSLLLRFAVGFDDSTRTTQAPGMPNHLAWTLGHCALTMHRAAEKFDERDLPASYFVRGDASAGDANRFDTESVCFNSTPRPDASLYPTLARAIEIFKAGGTRFAVAIATTSDSRLDAGVPWGPNTLTGSALVARVVTHNGVHTGQLLGLRRALGMARVIG
jgi:hypothetical protein